jgi:hypothetical protein
MMRSKIVESWNASQCSLGEGLLTRKRGMVLRLNCDHDGAIGCGANYATGDR